MTSVPPGRSTRCSSDQMESHLATCSITSEQMTVVKLSLGKGSSNRLPLSKRGLVAFKKRSFLRSTSRATAPGRDWIIRLEPQPISKMLCWLPILLVMIL